VADVVLADMVVADIDFLGGRYVFCCGQYRLAVADMAVADMAAPRLKKLGPL